MFVAKPGTQDDEQDVDGPYEGEYLDEPEPGESGDSAPAATNAAAPIMMGLPWDAAAFQQSGLDPDMQQYLSENPPFDFHNDHEALSAIMPESPALSPYQDASHPASTSKFGKLWQMFGPTLKSAAMGAAAGSAGGNFGQGFLYAQQASRNLQQLQMQRQAAKDLSDWRQAQTERVRQQTLGIPAQQAAMNSYRNARTAYIDAQAAKLRQAPNDKLVHAYNGADGKVHLVYQKPSGGTYEQASDAAFFVKPEAQQRPLLAHGHDHSVWLVDPQTGHARQVIRGNTNLPARRGTPAQFATIEQWKNREWNKVQNDVLLGNADKMQRLQGIQDQYERVIRTLGGEPSHFDVRMGAAQPAPQLAGAQGSQNDPWGLR
jgi:hypothetical protein